MNKQSEKIMRVQRRKKQHAVDAFGGECCICGYNKCINALEFHHIEGKEEKPSYVVMRWSWERAKKELEKCILVCANCHREIHHRVIDTALIPKPAKFVTKECKMCGSEFDSLPAKKMQFCSTECSHMHQRKVERPSKEELSKLLKKKTPWVKIGKMFGVSDNAVRKWAKNYGLL